MNDVTLVRIKKNSLKRTGHAFNIVVGESIDKTRAVDVTFYQNPSNKRDWGTEIYWGRNYIPNTNQRSYSKNYRNWHNLPSKYKKIAKTLRNEFRQTSW
jgi:hypothetical protein